MFGAESITVEPLTLIESACKPTEPPPPMAGMVPWKTFARACLGYRFSPCRDPGLVCVPTAEPPPEGFSQCIFQKGDQECPLEDYPNKHVFYDDISDTRQCTDCSCGPPEGSVCSAMVSVFTKDSCSGSDLVVTGTANSAGSVCLDLTPGGTNLGSMVATSPQYQPGVCEPTGGELSGSLELLGPSTFCCQ
jgi:hypothetical protein